MALKTALINSDPGVEFMVSKPDPVIIHFFVPKHEILAKQEAEQLMKKFGVNSEQLPQILSTDPIAEGLEAKKGDIIKVTRKSLTAGETTYYRIVL